MRPALLVLPLLATIGCAGAAGVEERPTSGAAAAPGTSRAEVIESGAQLYTTYCASCHGVTAHGDGPAAASLRRPPPDLTHLSERWGVPLDQQALAAFLDGREAPRAHGTPDMPVWGEKLYAGERAESPAREAARRGTILLIIEYLQTLQPPAEAPARP